MKTPFVFTFTILVFIAFTGCKKDKASTTILDSCQAKVCLNGGYCESGTCKCPPYFSGANCEIDNRPNCMKNHTGTINLGNNSGFARAVYINGQHRFTLNSGQSTGTVAFPIGNYSVRFYGFLWGQIVTASAFCSDNITLSECSDFSGICSN